MHVTSCWAVFLCAILGGGFRLVKTQVVEAGSHCANVTDDSGTEERCALCFFTQNCLENNKCLEGTTGYLCERCVHFSATGDIGYFRVGNICAPCVAFPWALIGLAVFLVLVVLNVAYNGLVPSTATKIKQMVDFLQYIILCVAIKVRWSNVVVKMASIFQFAFFSPSLATPSCILPESLNLYYMEWGTPIGLVVIFVSISKVLDKGFKLKLKPDLPVASQKSVWRKRSQYRRFAFLSLMVFYVPVTVSAIQSVSCTASLFPETLMLVPNRELFLYDLTVDCDQVIFSAVNNLYTLALVFYPCLLPVICTFFILRQRKWNFLASKIVRYGAPYEPYKMRCCIWEVLVMLRKLLYVIITYSYPISQVVQTLGHLIVTGAVFVLMLIFRPYRKFSWNSERLRRISPSMTFEVMSTLCILLLEVDGVLKAHDMPSTGLDWVVVTLVFLTISFWIGCFLAVQEEKVIPELEDYEILLTSKMSNLVKKVSEHEQKEEETDTKNQPEETKTEPDQALADLSLTDILEQMKADDVDRDRKNDKKIEETEF